MRVVFQRMLRDNKFFFLFVTPCLIFSDQASKYIVRSSGGFYICNQGIAFGLVVSNYLFYLLWLLIVLALVVILISKSKTQSSNQTLSTKPKKTDLWILDFIWNNLDFEIWISKLRTSALILILSGAVSNIIDRLYFGCVIDFVDLRFWPVFNLADSFIVIGVIMILLSNFKFKILNFK